MPDGQGQATARAENAVVARAHARVNTQAQTSRQLNVSVSACAPDTPSSMPSTSLTQSAYTSPSFLSPHVVLYDSQNDARLVAAGATHTPAPNREACGQCLLASVAATLRWYLFARAQRQQWTQAR